MRFGCNIKGPISRDIHICTTTHAQQMSRETHHFSNCSHGNLTSICSYSRFLLPWVSLCSLSSRFLSQWVSRRGSLGVGFSICSLSLSPMSSLFSRSRFPLRSHRGLHLSACFRFTLSALLVVNCCSRFIEVMPNFRELIMNF